MTPDPKNPDYTLYHPKWYRRRVPIFWWLGHPAYTRFITRELTSLAVAYSALLLLLQVWTMSRGEAAYEQFQSWLASPAVLVFHGVILLALVFHTITWLALAPKALVLRIAGRRLPDVAVIAAHYAAWFVASALVVWLLR